VGEFVAVTVTDGVATLRLDRPPMNALNLQVQRELRDAAAHLDQDPSVRAAVLYGGEKVFAAGADVKEMADNDYPDTARAIAAMQAGFDAMARIGKPVVAAITGYALGGGLELALLADFRVCGQGAKLGVPEISLGVIPGLGGTQRLPRLIGSARAKNLVYTGRFVDADEALRIGLVDDVVPDDAVYDVAVKLATRFSRGPAQALRAAKQAIDGGADLDLSSGLRLEGQLFAALFGTQDQKIGMSSFLERGPGLASFVGR
jgi:enoyl-CoA hydratase/carnithine racemase